MPPPRPLSLARRDWIVVAALTAIGLAIRIAAAQGALWLDEAWSAVHAHAAGTPLGVFLGINHDNNHHLNSLWMQAVGMDAAPVVQRALAIVAGTAMIPVAALIALRGGRAAALVAALLFAMSPFFVHYGSEARGYAPMLLALLVVMLRTDRWLHGGERPTTALVLWTVLGLLSQLMMVLGLVAVTGWAAISLWRRGTLRAAVVETIRTFAPAAVAGVVVVGLILLAARVGSGGMRFGAYLPYAWPDHYGAVVAIVAYTVGAATKALWPVIGLVPLLVLGAVLRVPRQPFYWIALVAFPVAVAVVQPANPGHPRYHALMAVALLLLIADVTGALIRDGGWRRATALVALAGLAVALLVEDVRMIGNQRADPGRAVAALRRLAPAGATMLVEEPSAVPVVELAALRDRYPLRITAAPCPAADFLFIDQYNDEVLPGTQRRCGRLYDPVASLRARGMTNFHWRVYRRR